MDAGIERVDDAHARTAARTQARGVVVKALVLATILSGLAYAVP